MDLSAPATASCELAGSAKVLNGHSSAPLTRAACRLPRTTDWVRRTLVGDCHEVWLLMQPRPGQGVAGFSPPVTGHEWLPHDVAGARIKHERVRACPLGGPGSLVWVAESHWCLRDPVLACSLPSSEVRSREGEASRVFEGATCLARLPPGAVEHALWTAMPRWASRLALQLIDCTPRRLQSVTEAEAAAAGARAQGRSRRMSFLAAFEASHGPRSSADNPWMWRVRFRPIPLISPSRQIAGPERERPRRNSRRLES